jgi:ABC-type dipeptide/oligopeptide/nickel transport system permease subunit
MTGMMDANGADGINLVGDDLRDAFDPQQRRR